jgi:3',5'-cyclic AMP phosphodiesterase CpdA
MNEPLDFWALGDLHYYVPEQWRAHQAERFAPMYRDLQALWAEEGAPAFCVSPGDLVETALPENFELARQELSRMLGDVPLYTSVGNHELWPEWENEWNRIDEEETTRRLLADYCAFWSQPARYSWVENDVLCIVLDSLGYPEPHFSEVTMEFLATTLAKYPDSIAVIFSHCPLYNTVLDRNPQHKRDYHSLEPFFSIQNSDEVRALLAKHGNGCLFISGHTHSGWHAPGLVKTERQVRLPVTFVNLMSPWYTGYHIGPKRDETHTRFEFHVDTPDLVISFAFRIYSQHAEIRLRDHREQRWMAVWNVPLR